MSKTAFITGITGQDGAYLSRLLLDKGYIVHGLCRRSSNGISSTARIARLLDSGRLFLHEGDLLDGSSLVHLIGEIGPDEIYNLAAQSHVHHSFETPEYTGDVNGLGTLRILEAIRLLGVEKKSPFLPGIDFGIVRELQRPHAVGNDPVRPAKSVCRRETLRLLEYGLLSRIVRNVRLQRNSFQPRESAQG